MSELTRAGISYRKKKGIPLDEPKYPKRQTKLFVDGEPAVEVAKRNGISIPVFRNRLFNGWSLEKACTVPTHKKPDERQSIKSNFVNILYNEIKQDIVKTQTDYEKIIILTVCKKCMENRWNNVEKPYHLTHNNFKRVTNYIDKMLIELDIPDEDIENIVNANIDMINNRVEKNKEKYFSEYELRKIEKWQNR